MYVCTKYVHAVRTDGLRLRRNLGQEFGSVQKQSKQESMEIFLGPHGAAKVLASVWSRGDPSGWVAQASSWSCD